MAEPCPQVAIGQLYLADLSNLHSIESNSNFFLFFATLAKVLPTIFVILVAPY